MNTFHLRLRNFLLAAIAVIFAVPAFADTLLMPKRDALKGVPFVVWGVSTLPNGMTYSIDFDDGNPPTTGVITDRSYPRWNQTYTTGGNKHIVLTVTSGSTTETASVDVQVFDPALISANDLRSVRINMAIEDGFRYLWTSQSNRTDFATNNFTNWGRPSFTALVVLAFENHNYRLPNDNTVPAGLYQRFMVRRGLNSLANQLAPLSLGTQPAGNPCAGPAPSAEFTATGSCTGYYAGNEGIGNAGYANALMILPFAGSGALNRLNTEGGGAGAGKSFGEITQRLVDAMAWGQNDSGVGQGGWNYGFNTTTLDGSTAGWNILAILDAEAASIPLPSFLKPQFTGGINRALNTDGSFDYNADNNGVSNPGPTGYRNLTRIGISLQGLFFNNVLAPYSAGTIGANAIDQISNRWSGNNFPGDQYFDTCGTNRQNKGCGYAMFNVFKGLKLAGVSTLPGVSASGGRADNDWYKDYQDWFLTNQTAPNTDFGGFWSTGVMGFSCCATDQNANNAIAELILSPVALVLPDEEKFASVGLSPVTATGVEGGTHTVTAHAESTGGTAVPGATVTFKVISGPNIGVTGTAVTDSSGNAAFTYSDGGPIGTFGTDKIQAFIGSLSSNVVEMIWTSANRAPVATDNTYNSNEDTVLSGNVITDAPADTDPDGDTMTASLVSGTSNGAVVLNGNGSFTYTPTPNYCGDDSFTYKVSDGTLSSGVATVTIHVICVNDPPVANDGTLTTNEDTPGTGTLTGSDIDGDTLTFTAGTGPSHGTVVVNPNGTYTYTPNANYNGPDSFTFTVSDGHGGTDTGAVDITVKSVNDLPFCGAAAPTIATLWSPNHSLFSIKVNGVTDPVEGSAVSIKVDEIWQDESTNTQGDGNTPIDGYGVGTDTAQVRAERSGQGNGRVYHIYFTGTDADGGKCTGEVKVAVPHDQGNGSTAIDDGKLFKSTGL